MDLPSLNRSLSRGVVSALLAASVLAGAPMPAAARIPAQDASRHGPVIAITIDDCFSRSAVLDDLRILMRLHVNATWFPVGRVMPAKADVWRRVADAGYPIGNHTWSHANLTHLRANWVTADIRRAAWAIHAATGRASVPFLRPPMGESNATVVRAAGAAGMRAVVLWDVTSGDTSAMPLRANVDYLVRSALKGKDGDILLLHANHEYTTEALPRIIAGYRARGFDFVTIGQLYGVKGPVPFPPGSLPELLLERLAAIVWPAAAPRGFGIAKHLTII